MSITIQSILAIAEICRLSVGSDSFYVTVASQVHKYQVSCQQVLIQCVRNRDAKTTEADALANCVVNRSSAW